MSGLETSIKPYSSFLALALLTGCNSVGDDYHCRITEVISHEDGRPMSLPMVTEFTFTVTHETDVYLAGEALSAGSNLSGDPAFVVISKLDGTFDGMYVQRGSHGTLNAGFCKIK